MGPIDTRHGVDCRAHAARIVACALLLSAASCATTPAPAAMSPGPLPSEPGTRQLALGQMGRWIYAALSDGEPLRLMLDASELKSILDTDGTMRVVALRSRGSAPGFAAAEQRAAYSGSTYQGVCFDGARLEPAGGPLGLVRPAFVFNRALVVAKQSDGSATAAWVEGVFMRRGELVVALVLSRVEAPRRDHTDLAVLHCDESDGLDSFHPVVGTGTPAVMPTP